MNGDPIAFFLSLLFLLGVLLLLASPVPALQRRFPKLFVWGFGLAAGTVVAMFLAALLG